MSRFATPRVRLVGVNPDGFSLGLAYLDAALRERFGAAVTVEQILVDSDDVARGRTDLGSLARDIAAGAPEVVGLSWYCWNHRVVTELARLVAALSPQTVLVVGGPETSTAFEDELTVLPDRSYLVFGEGEQAIGDLLDDLASGRGELPPGTGQVRGLAVARGPRALSPIDLAAVPSPVLAGTLRPATTNWIPSYVTTRGCIHRCAYCAWQDGLRERPFDLDRVMRELDVLSRTPYEQVWVTDAIFGRDVERGLAILSRLASWPHDTRFGIELHARHLDERIAERLADVRLAWAAIGVQSLATGVLKLTRRSPDTDALRRGVDTLYHRLADRGVIHLDLIFGLPTQTFADCVETLDTVLAHYPEATVYPSLLQLLPGTEFERHRRDPGWVALPPEGDFEVVSTPDLGAEEMERVHDILTGLDARHVTRDRRPTDAEALERLGRSLRGTAFARHRLYGRREAFRELDPVPSAEHVSGSAEPLRGPSGPSGPSGSAPPVPGAGDHAPEAIAIAPVTFGLGPASHACAIAEEIVRQSSGSVRVVGIGDGAARAYMADSGSFTSVVPAEPATIPEDLDVAAVVAVTDFDRAAAARRLGHAVVVVDPLYWMWDVPPMDPASADAYLCLEFPGVAARVRALPPEGRRATAVIPQIVDHRRPPPSSRRTGIVLNFGGVVAPYGSNVEYVRSVVATVGAAVRDAGCDDEVVVTCARAIADVVRPVADAAGFRAAELTPTGMLRAIASAARLVTVPGLSIVWEALLLETPTLLLPGLNYSQHHQFRAFRRFVRRLPAFSWDALDGYGLLPAGLPESEGVGRAVDLGRRFAADTEAQGHLRRWIAARLGGDLRPPALAADAPWTGFDGASHVARYALGCAAAATVGAPAGFRA